MDLTAKQEKHREEVQRLFVSHISAIKGFVAGLCPNFSDADDLVQQVFLVTTRKAGDFELNTNFLGWVRTIARYVVLEYFRHRKKQPCALDEDILELIAESADTMDDVWEDQRSALSACMEKITPTMRKLLEIRYLQGLMPTQIAERFRRSINAVNVDLARVRKLLRECAENTLRTVRT